MKKTCALLLACVMLLAFTACTSSPSPTSSAPAIDTTPATGTLTVGDTTQLNNDFFSGWTNIAANARIKELIYGYNTVTLMDPGYFDVDPIVVKEWNAVDNADGTKTYEFTINDNLKFSDGSAITATDFVFSMLLVNSKEFDEIAPGNAGGELFVGFEPFLYGGQGYLTEDYEWVYTDKDGKDIPTDDEGNVIDESLIVPCKTFSGIRLLDKYKFSVTYKAEELPFYHELAGTAVNPLPMSVIAPNVTITDTGKGATFSDNFTVELLQETIMKDVTGYRYNPSVTAGPYKFVSFDSAASIAIVEADPYFIANADGTRPRIKTIIVKKVEDATMMDELSTGQVDLLTTVSGGAKIDKGLDVVDAGKASYHNYPRAGYGRIAFHCDFSPTQFAAVRQAIAYCLDRNEFAQTYTGGYGIVVDGYYGASLWEYLENKDTLDARLNHYTYNIAKAKELLIMDGWVLDASGGTYTGGTRYKRLEDGSLMALEIEWFGTTPNQVTDLLNTMLVPEAAKAGIKLNLTMGDFPTLSANLNRVGIDKPVYSMYNLGTGFATMPSPWYYYDPQYFGQYNSNFIDDKQLYDITQDMKRTASDDKAGWSRKWVELQICWNQLMPDIPLYSDLYHDFYTTKLHDLKTGPLWGWSYAIQRAYLDS